MRVTGLDGKEYNLRLTNSEPKSGLHKRALDITRGIFPSDPILNEVSLPGAGNKVTKSLYADIMIPSRRLIIEVHGEQHYSRVPFFQHTQRDFLMGQMRDRRKKEWSELNGFTVIELPFDRESEWENMINDYFNN